MRVENLLAAGQCKNGRIIMSIDSIQLMLDKF